MWQQTHLPRSQPLQHQPSVRVPNGDGPQASSAPLWQQYLRKTIPRWNFLITTSAVDSRCFSPFLVVCSVGSGLFMFCLMPLSTTTTRRHKEPPWCRWHPHHSKLPAPEWPPHQGERMDQPCGNGVDFQTKLRKYLLKSRSIKVEWQLCQIMIYPLSDRVYYTYHHISDCHCMVNLFVCLFHPFSIAFFQQPIAPLKDELRRQRGQTAPLHLQPPWSSEEADRLPGRLSRNTATVTSCNHLHTDNFQ